MEKNYKITVITVCYNSEKTIRDTIESVLDQTYTNIEYILVDGKSSDSTVEIIKSYEKKAKEKGIIYRWISEPDKGIYDAMNKGLEMSTGELIGILNSDDWYDLHACESVLKKYTETNADMIHGDMIFLRNGKELLYTPRKNNLNYSKLRYKMILNHPTCFIKKSVYNEIGVFDLEYKIIADYDFIQRLYLSGKKIIYIEEILTYMRDGGVSRTQEQQVLKEVYMMNFERNKCYFTFWKIYQIIKTLIWRKNENTINK